MRLRSARLFSGACLALAAGLFSPSPALPAEPVITATPTRESFDVVVGEPTSLELLSLTNHRLQPISLGRIAPDCSCVGGLKEPLLLAPEEQRSVTLTVTAEYPLGTRKVSFQARSSDDTELATAIVRLRVLPSFRAALQSLEREGDTWRFTYEIETESRTPLNTIAIECPQALRLSGGIVQSTRLNVVAVLPASAFLRDPKSVMPPSAVRVAVRTDASNPTLRQFHFPLAQPPP